MAGWVDSVRTSRLLARIHSAVQARSGDIRFYTGIFVAGGIFVAYPDARGVRALQAAMGAGLFVAGVGIWFFQRWAKWLAVAVVTAMFAGSLTRMLFGEWSLFRVAMIFPAAWAYWYLCTLKLEREETGSPSKEDDNNDESSDNKPLISLVALIREPRYLDTRIIATAANRAWNTNLPVDDEPEDDAKSFVVGESPLFVVQDEERMFIIHNHDRPYFEDPEEVAAKIPELRAQRAVTEHKAWLAVDLMGPDEQQEQSSASAGADNPFRRIGRLLSELIDDDCLAVMYPDGGLLEPYSPEVHAKLESDDPLAELRHMSFVPVIQIAPDDPRMQAAVEEARRRWPEFVAAFEERTPEQNFAVKAPISDGENTEFMWLAVTAIENDVIYGTLNNEPVALSKKYYDQRLTVPLSDLNDWMYTAADEMHGGFTMKVLMEHYKEQQDED